MSEDTRKTFSCPWCYSEEIVFSQIINSHRVKCLYCDASGPAETSIQEAILKWNRIAAGKGIAPA